MPNKASSKPALNALSKKSAAIEGGATGSLSLGVINGKVIKQKKSYEYDAIAKASVTAAVQRELEENEESSNSLNLHMRDLKITENLKSFNYLPLVDETDAIRLVHLVPGLLTDPIECTLIYTTLSQKPHYVALSYTWGTEYSILPVTIDGKDMIITENLRSALIHLRTVGLETLWIDALCINQANVSERNRQVRQMGEIYRQANSVTIWLGPGTGSSSQDIKMLFEMQSLPSESLVTRQGFMNHEWNRGFKLGSVFNRDQDLSLDNALKALEHVSVLEYWRRVWIIQEVVLASRLTIQWGTDFADWKAIEYLFTELDQLQPRIHTNAMKKFFQSPPAQLTRLRSGYKSTSGCSLATLLEFSERSLCKDTRDKVYSLLGIATDCRKQEIQADYSKSIYELYEIVLRFFVLQGNKTMVMKFSQMLQKSIAGAAEQTQNEHFYPEMSEPHEQAPENMIEVYGIFRGPVVYLSQPWNKESTKNKAESFIEFLNQNNLNHKESIITVDKFLKQIDELDIRKVSMIAPGPSYAEIFVAPSRKSTQMSLDCAPSCNTSTEQAESSRLEAVPPFPVPPECLTATKNLFLFIDSTGQFGLCPSGAQTGDLVCQFHDCDIAVLVRAGLKGGRYAVVGRVLLAKRRDEEDEEKEEKKDEQGEEVERPAMGLENQIVSSSSSQRHKFSVPDAGNWDNFRNEIAFCLDVGTMRVISC